jgi:hypothetical protein
MLPRDLQVGQFSTYPPQARALTVASLETLRQLPLSFLPSMLRELIEYDFKFPAERAAADHELSYLTSLSAHELSDLFFDFSRLSLPPALEEVDWVNHPAQFLEQEAAYLWSTHSLDAFRKAATQYGDQLRAAYSVAPLAVRRLGIAVVGQGVSVYDAELFLNLRPHGTYFTKVKPTNGLEQLIAGVEARARTHPTPFAHWYVDGGLPLRTTPLLTTISYQALGPVRNNLLQYMQREIARPGMGPEDLRTNLARLVPADLHMDAAGDPVLQRFQMKILTEGSGTQVFSTTFTQWTTREGLRRAEPLTMLARFAPRQRQRPMNELLANKDTQPEIDAAGSLVDAEMAAYYHWINQRRLPEAEQSAFLLWFEDHGKALVIAPGVPRGVESAPEIDMKSLLTLATT